MALMELLEEKIIKIPLTAYDKEGIIRELVNVLTEAGKVEDPESLYQAVLAREKLGSTGLEDGFAVPHGKTAGVKDLAIAIGIAPQGVNFDSADGEPSKLFFLIAAPPDKAGPHIEALAEIAKLSRSKALCTALVNAKTPGEVVALLRGD